MGEVEYLIEGDKKGAIINSSSGAVDLSSATAGDITIKAVIAPNNKYLETTFKYNFTIDLTAPEYGNIINLIKELTVNGETASDSPDLTNAPTSYNLGQHGTKTFTVTLATNGVSTSSIDVDSSTGAVTLPANTGATVVTVKVSTPGGTKYAAGSKTYTVTFTKIDAPDLTFDAPGSVAWGTSVSVVTPSVPSNYNQNQMGTLSYEGSADGINVASNGTVTATKPGTVDVTVSTSGGNKYKAGEVGKYTVEFTKKNAPDLSFSTPSPVAWGTAVQAVSSSSNYNQTEMGTLSYALPQGTDSSISIDSNGVVTATKPGTVDVTVSTIAGGTKYNAGEVGTYTVEFTKKNAPNLTFGTPDQVEWGTQVSVLTPSNYNETEMGTLSYALSDSSDNGTSIADDGTVTANQSGSATVKVSTSGGTKYNAGSNVGTYTVIFNKQDITSVSGPTGLSGTQNSATTVDASLANGSGYNSSTMGTVTYSIKDPAKGATIDSSGAVNLDNATDTGDITIKATIGANNLYNETTVEYDFTINASSE